MHPRAESVRQGAGKRRGTDASLYPSGPEPARHRVGGKAGSPEPGSGVSPDESAASSSPPGVPPNLQRACPPSGHLPARLPIVGGDAGERPSWSFSPLLDREVTVEREVRAVVDGMFVVPVRASDLLRRLPALGSRDKEHPVLVFVETLEQACALRWLREYGLVSDLIAVVPRGLKRDAQAILHECARTVVAVDIHLPTEGPPPTAGSWLGPAPHVPIVRGRTSRPPTPSPSLPGVRT